MCTGTGGCSDPRQLVCWSEPKRHRRCRLDCSDPRQFSVLVRASEGGKMHTQAGRDQAPICVHSSTGHEREVQFWKKKCNLPWLHGRWHAWIGGQLSRLHHPS